MNLDRARDVVWSAVAKVAPEVDRAAVDGDDELRTQIDIDSMDFLNIVQAVYEATGIDVPERDYPRISSVNAFAAYLCGADQPAR